MTLQRTNPIRIPYDSLESPAAHTAPVPADLVGGVNGFLPAPAAAESEAEPALLQALRRRWARALGLGLLAGALGASLAWFLVPAKYTVRALLHVASQPGRGLFTNPDNQEGPEDFAAFQRTQAALLKSRDVIQAALRQPHVAGQAELQEHDHPAIWLGQSLKVETTLGPELLSVSLTGDHPDDLPVLVNAIAHAYLQELSNKERMRQPGRVDRLQENYRTLEANLRRKRAQLRDLESSLGIDPPQLLMLRYQTALTQRAGTEKELMQATSSLRNAQFELELLKDPKTGADNLDPTVEQQLLSQDAGYQALLTRKAQLEEEAARIRSIAAAAARDQMLRDTQSQLATLDREIASRRRALRPLLTGQNKAKLAVKVSLLQEQQKQLNEELKRQDEEVKRLTLAIRQPDKPTSDLEALRDEVTQAEQVLKKVAEQRDMLKAEPPLPARASLLEPADVPESMDMKRQVMTAGVSGGALFLLAVLGVGFMEHRGRRIYGEADVLREVRLPLLGTLPTLPTSPVLPGHRSLGNLYEQALLRISLEAIRQKLFREAEANGLRVILITSAGKDDGKSGLAAQLAASFAQAGRPTLLVDGDLRHPHAHRAFSAPAGPGFNEVLSGRAEATDVIWPTPVAGLWLIPGGEWDSAAVMALAQERGHRLFETLRQQYDFIVIDASPVLVGADALLAGHHSDGAIFSVQKDVTQVSTVQEAAESLALMGVPVLGTVVNGMNHNYALTIAASQLRPPQMLRSANGR